MIEGIGVWVLPLGFLPGLALIVASTSARLTALTHQPMEGGRSPSVVQLQLRRAERLAFALELLYIGIAILAVSVILGALADYSGGLGGPFVALGICGTVGLLVWATVLLVDEARLARQFVAEACHRLG
ncbi:MAG: hypothetical protein AAFU79_01470 [Myxococcota bacterium]